ncbi:hypothetical protein CspHIS471_0100100 [Cutaneotrichosporon sp. HIS471]|nr:hypothetical protein CspHIS471_0100100 [Cutaneotrichosporon sp. HIS471]
MSQNLTGQNFAGGYSTYFLMLAGSAQPLLNSTIITAVGLLANVASFFVIERRNVGRWVLLFGGVVIMATYGIALISVIEKGSYSTGAGIGFTFFLALFVAASTVGPGVGGWTYVAESGAPHLRSKTASFAAGCNSAIGLVFTTTLPHMLNDKDAGGQGWGASTGWMFGILGTICAGVIYFAIPDYTGRTFAQIDELFRLQLPARRWKRAVVGHCTV